MVLLIPLLLLAVAVFIQPGAADLRTTDRDGSTALASRKTTAAATDHRPAPLLYFSVERSFDLPDGRTIQNEDILSWDGQHLSIFFDGSDVGLAANKISGLAVISPTEILMTFALPVQLPGLADAITPTDVVLFTSTEIGNSTSGQWALYFSGRDAGLNSSAEQIDALELLPDGILLLSTVGSFHVPGLEGHDEDILAFLPAGSGAHPTGKWSLYLDGSDIEWQGHDVDAICVDPEGTLHFSTNDPMKFSIGDLGSADVFAFTPLSLGAVATGHYRPKLTFDADLAGLGNNDLKALDIGPPVQ